MQLNTTDEDNDTIPAYWEIQYFGGPTNATGHADSDHDGVTDYAEYVALTNPQDPASRLAIASATFNSSLAGAVGALSFTSRVARVYQLQTTTNLVAPVAWTSLLPLCTGVEGLMTLIHTNTADRAFYRVGVDLP